MDFRGNAENATINPYYHPKSLMLGRSGLFGVRQNDVLGTHTHAHYSHSIASCHKLSRGRDQQDMALTIDVVSHTLDVLLLLAIH